MTVVNAQRTAAGFYTDRPHEHVYVFATIHVGKKDHVVLCCHCGDVSFVPVPGKES